MHLPGTPKFSVGAGHANEIAYAFGMLSANLPGMPGNIYDDVSAADREIGASMMNAWVTFAKTG